jgi:hypothetical protein
MEHLKMIHKFKMMDCPLKMSLNQLLLMMDNFKVILDQLLLMMDNFSQILDHLKTVDNFKLIMGQLKVIDNFKLVMDHLRAMDNFKLVMGQLKTMDNIKLVMGQLKIIQDHHLKMALSHFLQVMDNMNNMDNMELMEITIIDHIKLDHCKLVIVHLEESGRTITSTLRKLQDTLTICATVTTKIQISQLIVQVSTGICKVKLILLKRIYIKNMKILLASIGVDHHTF